MLGRRDVIGDAPVGVLHQDLRAAALAALDIPRDRCREFGLANNWDKSIDQFLGNLAPFDSDAHFPSLSAERDARRGESAAAE